MRWSCFRLFTDVLLKLSSSIPLSRLYLCWVKLISLVSFFTWRILQRTSRVNPCCQLWVLRGATQQTKAWFSVSSVSMEWKNPLFNSDPAGACICLLLQGGMGAAVSVWRDLCCCLLDQCCLSCELLRAETQFCVAKRVSRLLQW